MKRIRGTAPHVNWEKPSFGPGRNIPFRLIPSVLTATRLEWAPPPIWLEATMLNPPPTPRRDAPKPKQLVTLQDKLKKIWMERHPGARQIKMVAADVGYERYWHHPCSNFVWRQARLMKQGFDQEEAYEIVEKQDKQAQTYRQIERMLAMEQLEEFGAKEVDTADMFLTPQIFEHKPPEAQLEEIIELRKKRGLHAPLDAREIPAGVGFFELRKLIEKRPDMSHFIDLSRLGPLYTATGAPIPFSQDAHTDDRDETFNPTEELDVGDKPKITAPSTAPKEVLQENFKTRAWREAFANYWLTTQGLTPELGVNRTKDEDEESATPIEYEYRKAELEFALGINQEQLFAKVVPRMNVDAWQMFLAFFEMGKNQWGLPQHAAAFQNFPTEVLNVAYRSELSLPITSDMEDFKLLATEGTLEDLAELSNQEDPYDEVRSKWDLIEAVEGDDKQDGEGNDLDSAFDDYLDSDQFEESGDEEGDLVKRDLYNLKKYDPRQNDNKMVGIVDDAQALARARALSAKGHQEAPAVWDDLLQILKVGELVPEIKLRKGKPKGTPEGTQYARSVQPKQSARSIGSKAAI